MGGDPIVRSLMLRRICFSDLLCIKNTTVLKTGLDTKNINHVWLSIRLNNLLAGHKTKIEQKNVYQTKLTYHSVVKIWIFAILSQC